jgi:hypothetical protein
MAVVNLSYKTSIIVTCFNYCDKRKKQFDLAGNIKQNQVLVFNLVMNKPDAGLLQQVDELDHVHPGLVL